MSSARFSRRGLFGIGLTRLVEERMSALDQAAPSPCRRPAAGEAAARRREEAAREWGASDGRAWFACLDPAAAHLVEACGVRPGERLLDVAAGDGNGRRRRGGPAPPRLELRPGGVQLRRHPRP